MPVLLTSGNPLGLRAVGRGGRTAVASYDQISRTLRQSLGVEHARLFAEPSQRSAVIDWYADVDEGSAVARLADVSPEQRERGLQRLGDLVRDIEALAASLEKSDRQDERILGDMLTHALEIPDEQSVFLAGAQPVVAFWGHVRDQGRPAVSPLQSLLRRRTGGQGLASPGLILRPEDSSPETQPDHRLEPQPPRRGVPVPALLWAGFALLLLVCGFELLRGCAIGLPHALTGWLIDVCPAQAQAGAALADERAKQAEYQAEYDDLVRQAALKRQACQLAPPVTPRPKPVTDPGQPTDADRSRDQMKIPPKKTNSTDFLEGCWRAHEGLTENSGGKSTGKTLKVTFCFNKDGTGSRTIRYNEDGAKCVGPVKAGWDGDILKVDVDEAICEGDHGRYNPAVDRCKRGNEGVARCDEVPKGQTAPNFTDFPFTRTDENP